MRNRACIGLRRCRRDREACVLWGFERGNVVRRDDGPRWRLVARHLGRRARAKPQPPATLPAATPRRGAARSKPNTRSGAETSWPGTSFADGFRFGIRVSPGRPPPGDVLRARASQWHSRASPSRKEARAKRLPAAHQKHQKRLMVAFPSASSTWLDGSVPSRAHALRRQACAPARGRRRRTGAGWIVRMLMRRRIREGGRSLAVDYMHMHPLSLCILCTHGVLHTTRRCRRFNQRFRQ